MPWPRLHGTDAAVHQRRWRKSHSDQTRTLPSRIWDDKAGGCECF